MKNTGNGCPRATKKSSFISPLIDHHTTLQQLMVDMRTSNTVRWKSHVIIYDSSITMDTLDALVMELRKNNGFITLMDLGETSQVTKSMLMDTFNGVRAYDLGNKFVAAVSKDIVTPLRETVFIIDPPATANRWSLISHVVSVRPKKQKRSAMLTKYALRQTTYVQIMTTYWLWPGGSS